MPNVLALDAAKAHLRVFDDDQDAAIADLVAVAEAALSDHLGRPLVDPVLGWETAELVPANVVHGIKLILADLYDNRNTPLQDMTALGNLVGRYQVVSFG